MATPRMTAVALAAVLTLIVTACSGGGNPADGPRPDDVDHGHRAGGPEERATASPPPPPPPPQESTSEAVSPKTVRLRGTELQVTVYDLIRGGATVELVFRIHNAGEEFSPTLREMLGTGEEPWDLAGVELVDTVNGRVHRVARDESGRCVCSAPDPSLSLWAGDTVELSATFAAPPEDVESLNVRLPLAGTFTGVRVV